MWAELYPKPLIQIATNSFQRNTFERCAATRSPGQSGLKGIDMRLILIGIGAAVAAASIQPASAQSWRPNASASQEIRQDVNQLERQISRAQERRTISRREAANLQRQAVNLRQVYRRYSANGLSRREVSALERQINEIRARLNLGRRDWDGRR